MTIRWVFPEHTPEPPNWQRLLETMAKTGVWARPLTDILERRPQITDNRLVRSAHVSQKVVAAVRAGGRISLDSADKLALAMGYSLYQLYGEGDGNPTDADREHWAAHLRAEQERQRRNGRAA